MGIHQYDSLTSENPTTLDHHSKTIVQQELKTLYLMRITWGLFFGYILFVCCNGLIVASNIDEFSGPKSFTEGVINDIDCRSYKSRSYYTFTLNGGAQVRIQIPRRCNSETIAKMREAETAYLEAYFAGGTPLEANIGDIQLLDFATARFNKNVVLGILIAWALFSLVFGEYIFAKMARNAKNSRVNMSQTS